MKVFQLLIVSLFVLSALGTNWKLVWEDNFDGNHVDESKWQFQIGTKEPGGPDRWGNNEAQYYTKENTQVKNGQMIITAKRQDYHGMKYTSSRLWTKPNAAPGFNGMSTQYGRIECKASLPAGTGMWPAFWMMPQSSAYGGWAASGEIDIMEARGREINKVDGTIHFGGQWPNNSYKGGHYTCPAGQDLTTPHVYAVEWTYGKIRWFIDGHEYFSADNWYSTGGAYPAPFNKHFYVIINLAVGGQYDGDKLPPADFKEASMYVDYVRVYHAANGDEDEEQQTLQE